MIYSGVSCMGAAVCMRPATHTEVCWSLSYRASALTIRSRHLRSKRVHMPPFDHRLPDSVQIKDDDCTDGRGAGRRRCPPHLLVEEPHDLLLTQMGQPYLWYLLL